MGADAIVCASSDPDYKMLSELAPLHVFESRAKALSVLPIRRVEVLCGSVDINGLRAASSVLSARRDKLLGYARKHHIKLERPGRVILAPPCSGKSTFVAKNDTFCDMDLIAHEFGLHGERYSQLPHTEGQEQKHYQRIDGWLSTLRSLGFRVIGSLYEAFVPDAVVIIDEALHKEYTSKRDDVSWDFAMQQRKMLTSLAKKHKVPIFKTIAAAVRSSRS